jgi:uncharacterized protein YejL (UPF0352 family)
MTKYTKIPKSKIVAQLKMLESIKAKFDKQTANKRLRLITRLQNKMISSAVLLTDYHDLLCFMRAYPDNRTILNLAEKELKNFGKRIDLYKHRVHDNKATNLLNSGITNTIVEHAYSLGVCEKLLSKYPKSLFVDWESLLEDVPDTVLSTLPLLVAWHENDVIDNDNYFDIIEWLENAKNRDNCSNFEVLINLFTNSQIRHDVKNHLFEQIDLPVSLQLSNKTPSRTLTRVESNNIYYQKEPIVRRSPDLRVELKKPAASLVKLSIKEGKRIVQTANEVLAVRYRELHPLTNANPLETYKYEPERGIQIYIMGTNPEIRLPLETNFGALLVRNGIPIGYGVGAILLDRVELAINIFPAFRNGESAFIIEQFFKMFYRHFGSRIFLVRSFQMGDGDDEPIFSGAFWFYYKLGFRAVRKRIRKMAEKEYDKIKKNRKYRSSVKTLRRLAKSDVFMHADLNKMNEWNELSLVNLGNIATNYINQKHKGNRNSATQKASQKLVNVLKVKRLSLWSENELRALDRLAPFIINIPNLSKWNKSDKDLLIEIIKAKGGKSEKKYVLLSLKHKRFIESLTQMATDKETEGE